MTHEQKPESAEFRTRAEERAATRTRQEQKEALMRHLQSGSTEIYGCVVEWVAERHIAEAEARGAAEQRRKDAEGVEPVYQRVLSRTMKEWQDVEADRYSHLAKIYPHGVRTLYTRPTNVAALEARVKELDGENKAWSSAVHNALTWLENGRKANARDELKAALRRAVAIREGSEHV